MLLHTRFQLLQKPNIHLPQWIRAPLGLTRNGVAHVATMSRVTAANAPACEFFVSAWDARFWLDLWRIEIDFNDRPGILGSLISILDDVRISVLAAETGIAGNCHTISLICDCTAYDSPTDDTTHGRRNLDNPSMRGLTALVANTLIDDLHFRREAGPRLRFRRINAYRSAHRGMTTVRSMRLRDAHLDLGELLPSARDELRSMPEESLAFSLTTDTKDRILRILLWPASSGLLQVKIHINKEARVLGEVIEAIRQLGFNIMKCQIRYSMSNPRGLPDGREQNYSTVDLILAFHGTHQGNALKDLQSRVDSTKGARNGDVVFDSYRFTPDHGWVSPVLESNDDQEFPPASVQPTPRHGGV